MSCINLRLDFISHRCYSIVSSLDEEQWYQVWIRPRTFVLDGIVYVPHEYLKYGQLQFSSLELAKEWAVNCWGYFRTYLENQRSGSNLQMPEFKLVRCTPGFNVMFIEESEYFFG